MPHQCTHCGKIYPDASPELLEGCKCGSRFFYYIKEEKAESLKKEVEEKIKILDKADKEQIEKDIREMTGLTEEPEKPVVLDLESVKVIEPGKFEIDVINLFSKKRPLIYKLEEGKYIIDLASSLKVKTDEINKKIKNPDILNLKERENKEKIKEEYIDLTEKAEEKSREMKIRDKEKSVENKEKIEDTDEKTEGDIAAEKAVDEIK